MNLTKNQIAVTKLALQNDYYLARDRKAKYWDKNCINWLMNNRNKRNAYRALFGGSICDIYRGIKPQSK